MKGKRLLLVLIFTAVIAVGWIASLKALSSDDNTEKQAELVAAADKFMEKELYIRAIPLYEEALGYKTEQNNEVEIKLLEAYETYGNIDAFISLTMKRITEERAGEDEYIIIAKYYINSMKLDTAMKVIKQGITSLDSDVLKDFYESNRYGYTLRTTSYYEITPTRSNVLMPSYDGTKWGYVDSSGRERIRHIYDSALPFNDSGYAVVSMDGTYYTIINTGDKYGVGQVSDVYYVTDKYILAQEEGKYSYYNYDFECVGESHKYDEITANSCGVAAVRKGENWGIITDEGKVVVDFILEDVAVNSLCSAFSNNGAMVKMDGKWYLIDSNGNKLSENGYSDAKAPESSGYIAVADDSGKWGFIDWKGNLVIPCQYRDAYSFSNHLAAVKSVDNWTYISEQNEQVIDEILTEAYPFHNGTAQVQFADKAALIILNYYEE